MSIALGLLLMSIGSIGWMSIGHIYKTIEPEDITWAVILSVVFLLLIYSVAIAYGATMIFSGGK